MEDKPYRIDVPDGTYTWKSNKPLDMAKDILGVVDAKCAPYPWCRGNPTVKDCIRLGYCARDQNCGE